MNLVPLVTAGLANGGLYALVALGLVLVYNAQSFSNFAHGELYMAGGFLGYTVYDSFSGPYWLALASAVFGAAFLGAIVERLVIRPVLVAPHVSLVMVTVGLSALLRGLARIPWGDDVRNFPPIFGYEPIVWRDVIMTSQHLTIVLSVVGLSVLLFLFFRYTLLGKRMRATAENPVGAQIVGVNIGRTYAITWAMAAAVGGLAGILAAPFTYLYPDMGVTMMLKGFAAAVLGGFGSVPGAIVGGLALGVIEMIVGGYVTTALLDISGFVVIMIVLIVRPQGLFGSAVIKRV